MPQLHQDQQKLHMADRARQAKDMRILGYTYQQIADHLGVTTKTVSKDLRKYLEDYPREHAEEHRQLQIEQVEFLMRKLSKRIDKGDLRAGELWLKSVDRLIKLTGTYLPAEDTTGEQSARADLAAMMEAINGSVD